MKYIRTKDGIYTKCNLIGYEDCWVLSHNCNPTPLKELKIIKQADTIEELCDCYIVWLKNREIPIIEKPQKGYRFHPSYFELGDCSFDKGYGAIWTDKGLIYVAKMNEKGELELL